MKNYPILKTLDWTSLCSNCRTDHCVMDKQGGEVFLKDVSVVERQRDSKSINHEPLFCDLFELFCHNGVPEAHFDLQLAANHALPFIHQIK